MTQTVNMTRRLFVGGLGGAALTHGSEACASTATAMRTIVFDTAAHLGADRSHWSVPLHVWMYQQQTSTLRKGAIAQLFRRRYGLAIEGAAAALFDERMNLLLADNKRGQTTTLAVAGQQFRLGTTAPNGHARRVVTVRPFDNPRIDVQADGARLARVHLVPPDGHSVISDIDDTVKDTGVLDRKQLLHSTFLKPFTAVPGMAALINRIAGPDGAVHYVSSSPWHLYTPLRDWLSAEGLPVSSLHLKHIRLKDRTILNITKSPFETKPPVIAEILTRWPRRRFTLIGDSGEKDPEVYAGIARAFPTQIARILIRRVPGDPTPLSRFDETFTGLPRSLWQLFDDPNAVQI